MKIEGIIWLRDVVDKLGFKHHVEIDEVEEGQERSTDIECKKYGQKRKEAI